MPSSILPSYVTVDPHSQWHVSGLLSTALECMTLSSRLRPQNGSRKTLDQLVNAVNINGNQNIAKMCMSIDQKAALNGHHRPGRLEVRAQSRDMRIPTQERDTKDASTVEENDVTRFDMDFFPAESGDQSRGRQSFKKPHVFGRAESYRAEKTEDSETNEEDEGHERARRRVAGLPIIQKTSTSLPFPLLDSFPRIFAHSDTTSTLNVSTSLSTDSTVALRVKNLQYIVNRAIGRDEREALSNLLGEIAEAYEEGWDSGSDEDDD